MQAAVDAVRSRVAYEQTTVPVSRSQEQIRTLLREFGATSFEFGEAELDGITWAAVGFAADGHRFRIRVPLKPVDEAALQRRVRRSNKPAKVLRADAVEQESKRIWRVLAWNLKARLEAVAEGVETLEEAFLAHLLIGGTSETVYDTLVRQGTVALDTHLTPRQLPAGD